MYDEHIAQFFENQPSLTRTPAMTSIDRTVSLRPEYLDNVIVQSLALAVRQAMVDGECPDYIHGHMRILSGHMRILSDSLEDAGCTDYDILAHLRLQNH